MGRPKKPVAEATQVKKPTFLVRATKTPEKQVQVSARIDESLKKSFDAAVTLANSKGMDLTVQHVFEVALNNAIDEVEEMFEQSCRQQSFDE